MLRKYDLASSLPVLAATALARLFATAFAIRVLPQPGGPYSSTPLGAASWYSSNRLLWT